ncbi:MULTISPECIES: aromatic ring-hydroxylating oxygenase subunit alpha [Pseudomonas syringae group]|uniref:aromatic ring-hydroxylating oxygenase subunit alpha n=1 Tax=Pseudomonas syringae group TaxID=136849 RepID=UPI001C57C1F4|nr:MULTISPECIES: aromatic ring-hydroxylating dioxygenase subunit alpha [Pseudomonas syringae group]MDU8458393.1 aromatic ring-hydroxylating dioxygenase subunit alpha [Pseudomonas syringae group sp. J254-4]QXW47311.1 aromatic ring-hydroxylating dioxygenase subunit alpha [Pseudomonas amygdali]
MHTTLSSETDTHSDGTREQWYVACTQKQLRKGKPYRATILGLNIVLFRRRDGQPAALLDQCVHRGTRLSAGKIKDDCLVCPYHGWRYDANGQVVHIPSVDARQGAAKSPDYRYRQRHFAVCEQDGLVWVYTGTRDARETPMFRLPAYGERPWQSYFMINTFDADVGSLVQNFLDVPHTVFVHEGIFRSSSGRTMEATLSCKAQSIEVVYHDEVDEIGMMQWLTNPDAEPLVHTDRFLAPNVTFCDYLWGARSGFLIVSQITPVDDRQSRVYTYIAYRFPMPAWVLRILRPFIHLYTHIVIQQDVKIIRAHREGLDNASGFKPCNVPADAIHVGVEQLLAAVRRGEALPQAQRRERRIRFEL